MKIIGNTGLPTYGLASVEPLFLSEMTVGAGKSIVNVQQFYKNVSIWGSTSSTVTDVDMDLRKGILNLQLSYPRVTLEAEYSMMGRILVLPVIGHGNCSIILDNAKPNYQAKFDIVTKRGKKFIKIKNQNYSVNAGFAKYHFGNFFNGNQMLGDEINKVLNDNWKEIYDEVIPGYEAAIGILLTNIANRFFLKVPLSEIFLPET
ncbi:hypothetical protein HHI36_022058 [Cryptolaemus montrouzieri]|uniref:Protein takeout n=1 Tax=Cryptolaemus montrouzieri TaxID=559131 RepID=A0ABD2MYS5_9CUCU